VSRCDKFLYGFKVAAYGRAGPWRNVAKWEKSREEMQVTAVAVARA
jgi:hypothetical protein